MAVGDRDESTVDVVRMPAYRPSDETAILLITQRQTDIAKKFSFFLVFF